MVPHFSVKVSASGSATAMTLADVGADPALQADIESWCQALFAKATVPKFQSCEYVDAKDLNGEARIDLKAIIERKTDVTDGTWLSFDGLDRFFQILSVAPDVPGPYDYAVKDVSYPQIISEQFWAKQDS